MPIDRSTIPLLFRRHGVEIGLVFTTLVVLAMVIKACADVTPPIVTGKQ